MLMTRLGIGALAILLGTMIQQKSMAADDIPADAPAALGLPPAPLVAPLTPPNTPPAGAVIPHNPGVYPRLNAPLYPSPVQTVPPWTGGTIITNQALAPHEMLYPHEYNAMYGPFYYSVKGGWIVTPFGVRQNECWKLEGTRVKVKYNSHRPFISKFFFPPSLVNKF